MQISLWQNPASQNQEAADTPHLQRATMQEPYLQAHASLGIKSHLGVAMVWVWVWVGGGGVPAHNAGHAHTPL